MGDNTGTPTRHQGSFHDQNRDYNKNFPSRGGRGGGPHSIQLNNIGGSMETSSSASSDSSLTLVNGENPRYPEPHRPSGYMDSVVWFCTWNCC